MAALKSRLIDSIKLRGPMRLDRFMELCLLDPQGGYYNRDVPIGAAGAFTTAPEISQMFGEIIGLFLAKAWLDQGAPSRFALVELGPGNGTLMADLLRAAKSVPGFVEASELLLVERSRTLRDRQRQSLRPHAPAWAETIEELPELPLFLVANEFFDALPIRQFRRCGDGWEEMLVACVDGRLELSPSEPSRFAPLDCRLADTREGDIVEFREGAAPITKRIAETVGRNGGVALVIDYGDSKSLGDTFQAVNSHSPAHPLRSPGEADLTAHVDFGAIGRSAAAAAAVTPLVPQGVFLERLGITERAQALGQSLSGAELGEHATAHRRLAHPDEMGGLYKSLAIYPRNAAVPPGFAP